MVTAKRMIGQKRLQKQRERARLAKQPRKWKAYQRKQRDRSRRARANSKIRLEAILKAARKQAVQDMRERITKSQTAHKKLLRVQAAVHSQQLEEYKKQVVSERAKAKAAVALAAQKLRDGLAQQMIVFNNRLREKLKMYEKGKVEVEKIHRKEQEKSKRWETWWSKLTVEYRRSIIRETRFKWHGSSFWDPGLHGQGHEE